jgi:hypothetical protein
VEPERLFSFATPLGSLSILLLGLATSLLGRFALLSLLLRICVSFTLARRRVAHFFPTRRELADDGVAGCVEFFFPIRSALESTFCAPELATLTWIRVRTHFPEKPA